MTQGTSTETGASCTCGCGLPVTGKSMYRPGHDARHAGEVARRALELGYTGTETDSPINELPTPALQAKAAAMVRRLNDKAQARAEQLEAKQAKKSAKAPKIEEAEPVKVGRWSYPARIAGGQRQRNTARDGSGDWAAHNIK